MNFFTIHDDFAKLELDPRMYNLESVYAAAYQVLESKYVYFNGNPSELIEVFISHIEEEDNTPKKLALAAKTFLNLLVSHTNYSFGAQNKEETRVLLLRKSFDNPAIINGLSKNVSSGRQEIECNVPVQKTYQNDCGCESSNKDDPLHFDDPEGIAIPWESKYADQDEKM